MPRRRRKRRAENARRNKPALQPQQPPAQTESTWSSVTPRVVVREARYVERLAYTRSQAAEALGIGRATLRCLLPYIETVDLPSGRTLIPVDELERLVAERRRAATSPRPPVARLGRKPDISDEVVERVRGERAEGRSFRQIADGLNADCIATAHGGERWWPSTVHAVTRRALSS